MASKLLERIVTILLLTVSIILIFAIGKGVGQENTPPTQEETLKATILWANSPVVDVKCRFSPLDLGAIRLRIDHAPMSAKEPFVFSQVGFYSPKVNFTSIPISTKVKMGEYKGWGKAGVYTWYVKVTDGGLTTASGYIYPPAPRVTLRIMDCLLYTSDA